MAEISIVAELEFSGVAVETHTFPQSPQVFPHPFSTGLPEITNSFSLHNVYSCISTKYPHFLSAK